jgi:hypothetical protein
MKLASRRMSTFLLFVMVCLFATGFVFRGKPTGQAQPTTFGEVDHAGDSFVIADFDGDEKPDFATVKLDRSNSRTTNYSIHFQLSEGLQPAIGITARTGGLQLFWRDVNGDDALDLVVRTSLDSNLVAVLLNDGHGKFTQAAAAEFPGLEKEPDFCLGAERRPLTDGVSSLPPQTIIGASDEQSRGEWLQVSCEEVDRQENQTFCSFLSASSAGRSPPEFS